MKEKILNVFFPRTCPVCGEVVKGQDKFVCDKCKGKVFYMKEPKCAKCGKSLKEDGTLCKDCREHKHAYEKGVCLFQYAGGIKESMYRFKYKNAREYGAYYGWETAKRYGKLFERYRRFHLQNGEIRFLFEARGRRISFRKGNGGLPRLFPFPRRGDGL